VRSRTGDARFLDFSEPRRVDRSDVQQRVEGTFPVFQYSAKSSDVIFAGISTTILSPRAVFSAAARRAVSAGSL